MLSAPLEWSKNRYSGFLDNKFRKDDIVICSKHFYVLVSNDLYSAANCLNSDRFTVNTDPLNYIKNDDNYLINKINDKIPLQN